MNVPSYWARDIQAPGAAMRRATPESILGGLFRFIGGLIGGVGAIIAFVAVYIAAIALPVSFSSSADICGDATILACLHLPPLERLLRFRGERMLREHDS